MAIEAHAAVGVRVPVAGRVVAADVAVVAMVAEADTVVTAGMVATAVDATKAILSKEGQRYKGLRVIAALSYAPIPH